MRPKLNLFSAVYVDDFKMLGPPKNLNTGWHWICRGVRMDNPTLFGKYLGCKHRMFIATYDDSAPSPFRL